MFNHKTPLIAAATVTAMLASLAAGPGGALAGNTAPANTAQTAGARVHTARTALQSCTGQRLIAPRGSYVIACGDGYELIAATDWQRWGATSASGTTNYAVNPCRPTCVDDHMTIHRNSHVRLFDVVRTTHGPVFAKAAISYRSHGVTHTVIDELPD